MRWSCAFSHGSGGASAAYFVALGPVRFHADASAVPQDRSEVLGHRLRETWRLTTFYPLVLSQPNPACCLRSGDLDANKPHLLESVVSTTRLGNGLVLLQPFLLKLLCLPHADNLAAYRGNAVRLIRCWPSSYAAFISAPSGITPSSKYRHSAIASRRATATMAIRLPRLFGPRHAVRCANQ